MTLRFHWAGAGVLQSFSSVKPLRGRRKMRLQLRSPEEQLAAPPRVLLSPALRDILNLLRLPSHFGSKNFLQETHTGHFIYQCWDWMHLESKPKYCLCEAAAERQAQQHRQEALLLRDVCSVPSVNPWCKCWKSKRWAKSSESCHHVSCVMVMSDTVACWEEDDRLKLQH